MLVGVPSPSRLHSRRDKHRSALKNPLLVRKRQQRLLAVLSKKRRIHKLLGQIAEEPLAEELPTQEPLDTQEPPTQEPPTQEPLDDWEVIETSMWQRIWNLFRWSGKKTA